MSQLSIDQIFQAAVRHHQTGQLAQAERGYRQILGQVPNHSDALHLLGVLAGQAGKPEAGIELIQRAIMLVPNQPTYHNNLGNLLMRMNRAEDALASYRQALQLKPGYANAYNNLGNALKYKGQIADATAAYREAIRLEENYADAHNNLGNILNQQKDFATALVSLRRAIAINPHMAEAHSNLGVALKELGQKEEAITSFLRALEIMPAQVELNNNLGIMLAEENRFEEAMACFNRVLQAHPNDINALLNLGTALHGVKRYPEAIACCRRVIELTPDHAKAHFNLGLSLMSTFQIDEAITIVEKALTLDPNYPQAYNNLGCTYKDAGRVKESIECYRKAVAISPDFAPAHSNLLHTLTHDPECDAHVLARENEQWYERWGKPLEKYIRPHANDRSPARRLRIGYLSPYFRDHVIGRNMAPLFREHDRDQFELFFYSYGQESDKRTEQFRTYASVWRDVRKLSDEALTERIRQDGIDILMDLNLHLANNRLEVLARKPAPVQWTFAGYPGTTGLKAIDYRLSDPYLDPPGMDESVYAEKTWRLPHCFWCYDPLGEQVPINALPALTAGYVTFGCLNNICKVSDGALRLWAQVLRAVPDSRLMLLALPGKFRQRLVDVVAAEGIAAERVVFVPPRVRPEYLAHYQQVDISLDPIPYNGHTTSLDSLWMGVPVVTLVGKTIVGRAGLSQLTNLNMPELIAWTPEEFVRISSQLANDMPRLASLRATLRVRMESSPLMDFKGFARDIEAAYRESWRQWCAGPARAGA